MKHEICKTGERMYLRTEIAQMLIELKEDLGWVTIIAQVDKGTAIRGPKHVKFSITQGDAKLLAQGLQEITRAVDLKRNTTPNG